MNLVIDFGNTAGKAAIFKGDEISKIIKPITIDSIEELVKSYVPDYTIISSSGISSEKIQEKVHGQSLVLSHKLKLPFQIKYTTPETLGLDRIAGVAGAYFQFPNENCLIIDMGTCITYDVLIEGSHLGGAISPGLSMRFKSLNTFTANLPLIAYEDFNLLIGDSTKTAILSGVINGVKAELDEIISQYIGKFGSLKVLICGGDYIFFENKLKASIFAAPELVLKGLNGILQYNVS